MSAAAAVSACLGVPRAAARALRAPDPAASKIGGAPWVRGGGGGAAYAYAAFAADDADPDDGKPDAGDPDDAGAAARAAGALNAGPCATCGAEMSFLAQIYAPVDDDGGWRALMVFVCNAERCASPGVAVVRLQDVAGARDAQEEARHAKPDDGGDDGPAAAGTQDGHDGASTKAAPEQEAAPGPPAKTPKKKSTKKVKKTKSRKPAFAWGEDTGQAPSSLDDLENLLDALDDARATAKESEIAQSELSAVSPACATAKESTDAQSEQSAVAPSCASAKSSKLAKDKGVTRQDEKPLLSPEDAQASVILDVVDEYEWQSSYASTQKKALEHAEKLLARYKAEQDAEGSESEGTAVRARGSADVDGAELEADDEEESEEIVLAEAFRDYLAAAPAQCLRYAYGGAPLLPRKLPDLANVPACEACGCPRVFELQLLPASLWEWRHSVSSVEVDFATVLVYVCPESCGGKQAAEHAIVVPA